MGQKNGSCRHWLILIMLSLHVMAFSLCCAPWDGAEVSCCVWNEVNGSTWHRSVWKLIKLSFASFVMHWQKWKKKWKGNSLFCHIEQPSLSKTGYKPGHRMSEFVSTQCLKRVIMWVKRNSRHKAGFMCACLDRVLMLGSIPCWLVIANTCANSISQQPAEGVLAPGLLGRRFKASTSLHQEPLRIHSLRGYAQSRGRTRSVQIPTSCFQSRAPGTRCKNLKFRFYKRFITQ